MKTILALSFALVAFALAAEPTTTLPVTRAVTDSTGRRLEGTILSKDADSIQFRRTSDGKEFDLPLAKLSAYDQTFVASLTTPPAPPRKKTTALLIDRNPEIKILLEKAGFAVTVAPIETLSQTDSGRPITPTDYFTLAKLTDDEIKNFDVIWKGQGLSRDKMLTRLIDLIPSCKGMVVWYRSWPITKEQLIAKKEPVHNDFAKNAAYKVSDENVIFYSPVTRKYNAKTKGDEILEGHPEILTQAVEEIRKLAGTHQP